MAVFTHEFVTPASVAPARLYKAMASDFHNRFPKIVDSIQSVETIEGNGGAGTIKKITLVEGGQSRYVLHKVDAIDEANRYVLHKVDAIDEANLVYNYSVVGGTGLPEVWEKISFETTILVDGPNNIGGSIRKVNVKYFTKGDAEVSEEVFKSGQTRVDGLVKFLEGYLLANPDYN